MPPNLLLKTTLYGCVAVAALAASLPQPREGQKISLALSLDAPPTVNGISDFTITGTLKNESPQDILVVKDPNGILYEFFTADALDFERTDSNAKDAIKNPSFVGYKAKWDMKHYLQVDGEEDTYLPDDHKDVVSLMSKDQSRPSSGRRRGNSEDSNDDDSSPLSDTESSVGGSSKSGDKRYPPGTTLDLPAGKTITFNYKVGNTYDFSRSGAGAYTLKLKHGYFYVLVDDIVSIAQVEVNMNIQLEGNLKAEVPKPRNSIRDTENDDEVIELENHSIVERAGTRKISVTTRGCGKIQTSIVDVAAQHANRYAAESHYYMSAMTGPTERYENWFGKWNTGPKAPDEWRPRDQVAAMYKSLSEHSFLDSSEAGGYTYDCTCKEHITAYVMARSDFLPPDADAPAIIYLCKGFRLRTMPMVGSNSKAGTLIHEAAHITYHLPAADDHTVFHRDCEQLAINNPFLAATNSDNYEYFSENTPFLA